MSTKTNEQRYDVLIMSPTGKIISTYGKNLSLRKALAWAKLGKEQDAKNGILNVRYSVVPTRVKEVRV